MTTAAPTSPVTPTPVYTGQFGSFTITDRDRQEVLIYRSALAIAALSWAIGVGLALTQPLTPALLWGLTIAYGLFWVALGVSLAFIHIYLELLHRFLQVCWGVGGLAAVAIGLYFAEPLPQVVYAQPLTLLGVGFTFVALTGVYFKEAFCFNRLETRLLTPLVPFLLLGHLSGVLPLGWERGLLGLWAGLFLVFAGRKVIQAIPPDIGDKSVFAYLRGELSDEESGS